MTQDTETRIVALVREHWGFVVEDHPKGLDAALIEDCNADSLDIVEIVMAIEDEFKIEIKDDETEPFAGSNGPNGGTLRDLVTLTEGKL